MFTSTTPLTQVTQLTQLTKDPLSPEALSALSQTAPSWLEILTQFAQSTSGQALRTFLCTRQQIGVTIYPPDPLCCLAYTPLDQVKVVILGQDPYHGPGQAEGLAFSVPSNQKPPPSLRNIFKEVRRDVDAHAHTHGFPLPNTQPDFIKPSLWNWAKQGVLLWNTVLTVEATQPASHTKQGWEVLTEIVLRALLAHSTRYQQPLVFLLWGTHAQRCAHGLTGPYSLTLQANHPSPLSALRPPHPFIGCGHFSKTNRFLEAHGQNPIQWLV
jgi:uracil-DNA glycosylase